MKVPQVHSHIATNKNLYLWSLFAVSTAANLGVYLTYKKSGAINFSFMTYKLLFEPFIEHYFSYSGPGIPILFAVCNFLLLYASFALLLNRRFRPLGWVLGLLLIASLLPIINFRNIFI